MIEQELPKEEDNTERENEILPTLDQFTQLTEIEPVVEEESHKQLKRTLQQRGEEMLEPWEKLGLISPSEKVGVAHAWKHAILLNNEGMKHFGEYQAGIFEKASKELSALDKENTNPEIQGLINEADSLVESIKLTTSQAGALVFRPNEMQVSLAEVSEAPSAFILINADKLDTQSPGAINAAAYEESAHLISKLPKYKEANKKWLEETMARVVAFGTESAHRSQDTQAEEEAIKILRLKDYARLFNMINKQIGDNGETLTKMFFGKEPANSPMVAKVEKATKNIDMVASVIDAGVSLDSLLEQMQ